MASELDPLSNFDVDLQEFYFEALTKELDLLNKQNARSIKLALKEVVEAYKRPTGATSPTESIRFDSAAKRCAYVLKHGPCFTSAVAKHAAGLAVFFRRALLRGEVRLCCLGGGPGSDAVAVVKVLSSLFRRRSRPLKVTVTVVDVNGEWAATAGHVLWTVTENPALLGIEGVEVSLLRYLSADLTRPIEGEVRMALEDADLVTMVYFLSAVNRGQDGIESLLMVKEIMSCMGEGSILFFLDSAMDVHYKQMNSAAKSLGNLVQVYGPHIEEFHTLSLQSVTRFLELYKRLFGKFMCLTNCFVSSSAWYKTSSLSPNRTLICEKDQKYRLTSQMDKSLLVMDECAILVKEHDSLLWLNSQRQQSIHLTARMVQFRAQIGKLLAGEFGDQIVVENEISDDLPDDAFDHFLVEYCDSVPEYFFQTKAKKKRIFTGLPVSI